MAVIAEPQITRGDKQRLPSWDGDEWYELTDDDGDPYDLTDRTVDLALVINRTNERIDLTNEVEVHEDPTTSQVAITLEESDTSIPIEGRNETLYGQFRLEGGEEDPTTAGSFKLTVYPSRFDIEVGATLLPYRDSFGAWAEDGVMDAEGARIGNVSDPVNPQDAVNRRSLNTDLRGITSWEHQFDETVDAQSNTVENPGAYGSTDSPAPEMHTERAYLTAPSIAPTPRNQNERQIQTVPRGGEKTEIFTVSDATWTSNGLQAPSIVRADLLFDNPLGKYYMYYSEDHAGDYIALAYSDDLKNGWTDHGTIYSAGARTDTPAAMWNPYEEYLMLFHRQGAADGARTRVATSTDGEDFTDQGIVIEPPDGLPTYPSDQHTGYFVPNAIGDTWIGYHLLTHTDTPRFAMSYATDNSGLNWRMDPRPLSYGADMMRGNDLRIEWNESNIVQYNGSPWWFGIAGAHAAGGNATGGYLAAAPLTDDWRHLASRPVKIAEPTETWEEGGHRYIYTFVDNSTLYISFATLAGSLGLIEIEGGVL